MTLINNTKETKLDILCIEELYNIIKLVIEELNDGENGIKTELDKFNNKHTVVLDNFNSMENLSDIELGDNVARLLSNLYNVLNSIYLVETTHELVQEILSDFKGFVEVYDVINAISNKSINVKNNKKRYTNAAHTGDLFIKYLKTDCSIVGGGIEFENEDTEIFSEVDAGSEEDFDSEGLPEIEGGALGEFDRTLKQTPEDLKYEASVKAANSAVRQYVGEINEIINNFVENVYEASKYLADTTIDNDKLIDTIDNLRYMERIRDPSVYLALVDFYFDKSKEENARIYRERLKKSARALNEVANKTPAARKFLSYASSNISKILKKIDQFRDLIGTVLIEVRPRDIEDIIQNVPQSMGNIKLALNRLYNSLNISQMKKFIKESSTDLCRYTSKYPEMLAWTVNEKRKDLDIEFALLTGESAESIFGSRYDDEGELIEPDDKESSTANRLLFGSGLGFEGIRQCSLVKVFKNADKNGLLFDDPTVPVRYNEDKDKIPIYKAFWTEEKKCKIFTKFIEQIEEEFKAKHRIYKAIESLDLILSSYTKELVKDIDMMKEVKRYLEDTKVYMKWFTEFTGDSLAACFESMPTYVGNPGNSDNKLDCVPCKKHNLSTHLPRLNTGDGNEYTIPIYNPLGDSLRNPSQPTDYYTSLKGLKENYADGNDYYFGRANGVLCTAGAVRARKNVDDFYNNFQALKNIFHSFITLYNHLLDKKMKSVSCMSPSQIYYAILSYLKQSALARRLHGLTDKRCHNICTGRENPLTEALEEVDQTEYSITGRIEKLEVESGYKEVYNDLEDALGKTADMRDELKDWMEIFNKFSIDLKRKELSKIKPQLEAYVKKGKTTAHPESIDAIEAFLEKQKVSKITTYSSKDRPPFKVIAIPQTTTYTTQVIGTIMPSYSRQSIKVEYSNKDIRKEDIQASRYSVYECEDRLCAMSIKSVASAVLSCMGLFAVSQQPVNIGLLRSVRSIAGGGKDAKGGSIISSIIGSNLEQKQVPAISESAFDSYYYIVRLAEFYKELFKNSRIDIGTDDPEDPINCHFRIPTDLNNEFGVIHAIVSFKELGLPYTEDETKVLIREINKLHSKYRTTNDLIIAFVKDVNRKYSCLVDKEAQLQFSKFEDKLKGVDELSTDTDTSLDSIIGSIPGSISYRRDVTGSLPFDNETALDSDINAIDSDCKASNSLGKGFAKMIEEELNEEEFKPSKRNIVKYKDKNDSRTLRRTRKIIRDRTLSKYKFCCEYKLYFKIQKLRETLDTMFDNYLNNGDSTSMKPYPMSTEEHKKSYHKDYIEGLKERMKDTKIDNEAKFKISTKLINSLDANVENKNDGIDEKTLYCYTESALIMLDTLIKNRDILYKTMGGLLKYSGLWFYLNDLSKTPAEAQVGARDTLDKILEYTIKENNPLDTNDSESLYKTIDEYIMNLDPDLQYRLQGLGLNYDGVVQQKNALTSLLVDGVPTDIKYDPHTVAIGLIKRYNDEMMGQPEGFEQYKTYLYRSTLFELVLARYDLTHLNKMSMSMISRLSSTLGGYVSSSISTQGTYLDLTPLENLISENISETKELLNAFYDKFPRNSMLDIFKKTPVKNDENYFIRNGRISIVDVENDYHTLFDDHYSKKVNIPSLVTITNKLLSMLHTTVVSNFAETFYPDGKYQPNRSAKDRSALGSEPKNGYCMLVSQNYGGNAIIASIMPDHYELHKSNIKRKQNMGSQIYNLLQKIDKPPSLILPKEDNMSDCILSSLSDGTYLDSLLPALNYYVKLMLTSFMDFPHAGGKIYKEILNMIMRTKLSHCVENINEAYNDMLDSNFDDKIDKPKYIHYALPKTNSLLCKSLAIIIYRLF